MALAAWRREAHSWRLMALFFLLAGGLGGLVSGSGALDPRCARHIRSMTPSGSGALDPLPTPTYP